MSSERLYPGTGDIEDSVNLTGNAIKVDLVLFMSLEFISLHKTVEKSISADCFLQGWSNFFNLPLSWWNLLKTKS